MKPKPRIRLAFLTAAQLAELPTYSLTSPTLSYSPQTDTVRGVQRWKRLRNGTWWLGEWLRAPPCHGAMATYEARFKQVILRP